MQAFQRVNGITWFVFLMTLDISSFTWTEFPLLRLCFLTGMRLTRTLLRCLSAGIAHRLWRHPPRGCSAWMNFESTTMRSLVQRYGSVDKQQICILIPNSYSNPNRKVASLHSISSTQLPPVVATRTCTLRVLFTHYSSHNTLMVSKQRVLSRCHLEVLRN